MCKHEYPLEKHFQVTKKLSVLLNMFKKRLRKTINRMRVGNRMSNTRCGRESINFDFSFSFSISYVDFTLSCFYFNVG